MTSATLTADAFDGLGDTPRRIVDAAIRAFAERGYHATTTRDIALGAGLSPAGMYVHYASKAAVLAQISRLGHQAAQQLVDRALALPEPAGAAGSTSAERLRGFVETFTAWHARHHQVARVVQYELGVLTGDDRAEVNRIRREIESSVEAEVRRGVATGELTVDHPRATTRAVLSLCIDVSRWYDPAGRESPDEVAALYGRLALRMLGARTVGDMAEA
jgi:AcrR family transcriptional regulator